MTQLIIISIYLLLLVGLGFFASRMFRGTSKDYMLASHSIGPFLLLMSLFGTTMTAFALVGSTGEAYKEGVGVYGLLASSSGIIHSLCFFLVGVKVWALGKKYGYTTQIEFFRDRLESDKIGLLLFPILVGLVIPYLLIGVMASGTVINSVTEGAFQTLFAAHDYGVPAWIGSLVICCVVLTYVFFGGMRGTAWANAFQTLVFMALGLVTFFVISHKLGGLQTASQRVLEAHPSKLSRHVTDTEHATFERSFESWKLLASYNWASREKRVELTAEQKTTALAQFTPRMPGWQIRAQAVYASKNGLLKLTPEEQQQAMIAQDDRLLPADGRVLDEAGKPLPLTSFAKLPASGWKLKSEKIFASKIGHPNDLLEEGNEAAGRKWTRKKAWGIYRASNWAPQQLHSMNKWKFLTYLLVPLSVGMFPHLFQHWLTAKSASSFKLPIVAHPIFIMIVWVPCVLIGVWATAAVVDGRPVIPPHFPPNAVLGKLVKDLTGDMLGGFLTAGILAAIMSSLDSQFLCIGTMFTTDIVTHYGGKNRYSDKQVIFMARAFIVGIVAVTYAFSLLEPRGVFTLGVWCFSGFSGLFPIVFAAIYWRRLTAAGAYAGILAAIASWIYLFVQSDFASNSAYTVILGPEIHVMPVAVIVLCSTVATLAVSLVTRPPSEKTLARFFETP